MKYSKLKLLIGFLWFSACTGQDYNPDILTESESDQILSSEPIYLSKVLSEDKYSQNGELFASAIQAVLDKVKGQSRTIVFPESRVILDQSSGIILYSNQKLVLGKAQFVVSPSVTRDGQVFYGKDVSNVEISGGEFYGNRQLLPVSVNVAGIFLTGNVSNIKISKSYFSGLSSNAIRVIGPNENQLSKNITITGITTENCCNEYYDYLQPNKGPAEGTTREDQGNIALYYVDTFTIDGCILNLSKSDGTHFYKSINGFFTNNTVKNNRMGGFFAETSKNMQVSGNTITQNGSRGCTIERLSSDFSLKNNLISQNGREGIWIDDSQNIQILNNTISLNGRKFDVPVNNNVRITDTSWPDKKTQSLSRNISIMNNIIETDEKNKYSIIAHSCARDVNIRFNTVTGAGKIIMSDSWISGSGTAIEADNINWKTSTKGNTSFIIPSMEFGIDVPHNLDIFDRTVTDYVFFQFTKIVPVVTLGDKDLTPLMSVGVNRDRIRLFFRNVPGTKIGKTVTVTWSASLDYPKK